MPGINVDNAYTDKDLEELFGVSSEVTAPQEQQTSQETPTDDATETKGTDVEQTKAFANRLKERTDKAVTAERERIATSLGYASYADMMRKSEQKVYDDNGLDPDVVSPIVDELVKKRIEQDPRMQELESYRQKQAEEFAQKELKELSKLTGTEYTSLDDVPKDVIEDWKTSGSLKKSYLSLHGEELITKTRRAAAKGTTEHLQSQGTAPTGAPTGKRALTDKEKRVWKQFYPNMTEEELNKKFVDKE